MKAKITNSSYQNVIPTWRFGTLMVLLCFLFFDNAFSQNQGQYTLSPLAGSPVNHSDSYLPGVTPFCSSRKDSKSQYIYLASEFTAVVPVGAKPAGFITSLAFNVTALGNGTTDGNKIHNFNIYLRLTPDTKITKNTFLTIDPLVDHYYENVTLSITEPGWFSLDLTQIKTSGFYWDGTSNILVEICQSSTSKPNPLPSRSFQVQTSIFSNSTSQYKNSGMYTYNNYDLINNTSGCDMNFPTSVADNTDATNSSTIWRTRPDIRFTFACDGTPTGGAVINTEPLSYCTGSTLKLDVLGSSKSSGLTYIWEKSYNGSFLGPLYFTNLAFTETYDTVKEDVKVWYRRVIKCGGNSNNSDALIVEGAKTWTGPVTQWMLGGSSTTEPDITESAIFDADFDSNVAPYAGVSNLEFCSMSIKSGNVIIRGGDSVLLENGVTVTGGSLTFDNNASLNQVDDFAVNVGDVKFIRNTTPVRRYDYTYWSSPVENQNLRDFSDETRIDKYYTWEYVGQDWFQELNYPGPAYNTTMAEGKGYIIRAPDGFDIGGDGEVWPGEFVGVPNNGIISVDIAGYTTPPLLPLPPKEKWNLIGNPYPSALDSETFFLDNSSVLDGTFYVWTHNSSPKSSYPGPYTYNYNVADYASFNMTGIINPGKAATTNPLDDPDYDDNFTVPTQYIASGQSFMIKGTTDDIGVQVFFNNNQRVVGNNTNFYKSEKNSSIINSNRNRSRVWLEYLNENGGFKQLLIGYLNGASADYDNGYDGDIMGGEGVSFFSIIKDHQLGIQGKGLPFENSDIITLGFTATVAGNNSIALVEYDGLFENQEVYLEDRYLNVVHNLKLSNYTFVANVGTFLDRFVLRYTENALNLNPNDISANSIIAFNKSGDLVIDAGLKNIQTIKVYDLSGRLVQQKNNCQSGNVVFDKPNWKAQLMLVTITTEDNEVVTRKVLF